MLGEACRHRFRVSGTRGMGWKCKGRSCNCCCCYKGLQGRVVRGTGSAGRHVRRSSLSGRRFAGPVGRMRLGLAGCIDLIVLASRRFVLRLASDGRMVAAVVGRNHHQQRRLATLFCIRPVVHTVDHILPGCSTALLR